MPLSRQGRERLDRLFALCESKRSAFDLSSKFTGVAFSFERQHPSFAVPRDSFSVPRAIRSRRLVVMAMVFLLLIAFVGVVSQRDSVQPAQANLVNRILPTSVDMPIASGAAGNGSIAGDLGGASTAELPPAAAGVFATPAPASVTSGPPLKPHEVFGFAPYWALADSAEFDLADLTTVDYFGVGINPDGSLSQSGAGWQGYDSQNFVDLIDRAHAAGDRVVVTADDFSQSSLDQLASSPTAPQQLAESLLYLVKAKSLDGVNLDLEGQGYGDQTGITNLVKVVSHTLKAANPDYQVTMDTYASSAGEPTGFYDVPALSQYVDGIFVMAYQLNLRSAPGSQSELTSSMFSNQTALNQYTNAIPANKVILGLPFFGYDWPTTNGTLSAQPSGGPTLITYGQEVSSGHPMYWDPVTDTAWTSYRVGSQWHEAFFENPNSLYLTAQMARHQGIAGVGIWALGMDGPNDQATVPALAGHAPTLENVRTGPSATSTSPSPVELAALRRTESPVIVATAQPEATTTTTTQSPATSKPVLYSYGGNWLGVQTRVLGAAVPSGRSFLEGAMIDFVTADPNLTCLDNEPELDVYYFVSDPTHDYVIARKSWGDCANAAFVFQPPTPVTAVAAAQPAAPPAPVLYSYAGKFLGVQTRVLAAAPPSGPGTLEGNMVDFATADPNLACLDNEPALHVYHYDSDPTHDYVMTAKAAGDCANAAFVFLWPAPTTASSLTAASPPP